MYFNNLATVYSIEVVYRYFRKIYTRLQLQATLALLVLFDRDAKGHLQATTRSTTTTTTTTRNIMRFVHYDK